MPVEDLCRALRQGLFVDQLMPRVLDVLAEDPLAGECYDGELIAALAKINLETLKSNISIFIKAIDLINRINKSDIDNDLKKDISKLNKKG